MKHSNLLFCCSAALSAMLLGCTAPPLPTPALSPTLAPISPPRTAIPASPTLPQSTLTPVPPTPSPRPTAELVVSEEFGDASSFWCQKENAAMIDWYCQDGELHAASKDQHSFQWKGLRPPYKDFIMQVQVRFIGDVGAAVLVFRATLRAQPSMYVSFVTPTGFGSLAKYTEGKQSVLIPSTDLPAVKKGGATNTLQIVAQGSRFTLYANNVELARYSDSSYAEGNLGLGAADGAHVIFDNLKIWVPNAPTP